MEVPWCHQAVGQVVADVESARVAKQDTQIKRGVVAKALLDHRLGFEDVVDRKSVV